MKIRKAPQARRLPSGSWMCRVTVNGQGKCFTGAVKSEIEKLALEYKSTRKLKPITSMTVGDALSHFIDVRRNVLSPSTIRGYEQIQRCRFLRLQKIPIAKLLEADVQEAINLEASSVSAKTVKNAWGLFNSAIKSVSDMTYHVRLPQAVHPDTPWLDPDQLHLFLEELRGTKYELGALLALHSLRRSEILDLTQDDIEVVGDNIRIHVRGSAVIGPDHKLVHKETNKSTSSARIVDVWLPRLVELLHEPHSGYLVTMAPDVLRKGINRTCARCGLPDVGIHGLRRSFASLAYHEGLPERVAAEIGGWSDLQTMHKHYVKISERDKAQAIDALRSFGSQI